MLLGHGKENFVFGITWYIISLRMICTRTSQSVSLYLTKCWKEIFMFCHLFFRDRKLKFWVWYAKILLQFAFLCFTPFYCGSIFCSELTYACTQYYACSGCYKKCIFPVAFSLQLSQRFKPDRFITIFRDSTRNSKRERVRERELERERQRRFDIYI